ncbi:hypothetical protein C4546_04710 [Candidatus Parcubacteria bacterium]|nr:MAG: hypothetical protein C4546_04710 [Candidatus Parcubacteria bacterium]
MAKPNSKARLKKNFKVFTTFSPKYLHLHKDKVRKFFNISVNNDLVYDFLAPAPLMSWLANQIFWQNSSPHFWF